MPVPARRQERLILVDPPPATSRVVAYVRVSSPDQRADLERQAGRVVTGARAGLSVAWPVRPAAIVVEDLNVAGMLRNRRLAKPFRRATDDGESGTLFMLTDSQRPDAPGGVCPCSSSGAAYPLPVLNGVRVRRSPERSTARRARRRYRVLQASSGLPPGG